MGTDVYNLLLEQALARDDARPAALLLREAIRCDESRLIADAAEARESITTAVSADTEAAEAIQSHQQSIAVRRTNDDHVTSEVAKRRSAYEAKAWKGTYKTNHAEEVQLRLTEDAQRGIRQAVIAHGESLLPALEAARRATTLVILKATKYWCHCQGLVEAKKAQGLYAPLIANDPHTQIDMSSSKFAAYASKEIETDLLIAEFHRERGI